MSDNARKYSLSFTAGRGSLEHNARENTNNYNVDIARTKNNIVLINDDIEKVYDELFGKALSEYNEKQKRKDRRIENYYDKIRREIAKAISTGKHRESYTHKEIIVQVGNKDDVLDNKTAIEIYKEYYEKFVEKNPNMRVFQAIIHLDESTPHLHMDYVPWATKTKNKKTGALEEYKRGMKTQVANDNAIYEMGNNSWNEWKDKNYELLEDIAKTHNIERKLMYDTSKHMNIREYKELKANEENSEEIKIDIDKPQKEVAIKYHSEKKLEKLKIKDKTDERKVEYKVLGGGEKPVVQASEYNKLLEERNSFANKINSLRKQKREELINIKNDVEARDKEWSAIVKDKSIEILELQEENEKLKGAFFDIATKNKMFRNKSYVTENAVLSSEVEDLKASLTPLNAHIKALEQELNDSKDNYSKGYTEGENRGYSDAIEEVLNEWHIDEFQSLIDVKNAEISRDKIENEIYNYDGNTLEIYKVAKKYNDDSDINKNDIDRDEDFYNSKYNELLSIKINMEQVKSNNNRIGIRNKLSDVICKANDLLVDIRDYVLDRIREMKDKTIEHWNRER